MILDSLNSSSFKFLHQSKSVMLEATKKSLLQEKGKHHNTKPF